MADAYTSHFSPNNIPYGIASSAKRPSPQAATRINDETLFLADLSTHEAFSMVAADLPSLFSHPTLNAFAALPKHIHSAVRTTIRNVYTSNEHVFSAEPLSHVTLHLPVSIGDFTDYSASSTHVLNAGEAILGTRALPPSFASQPIGYAGRCSSIVISGTPVLRPRGQYFPPSSHPCPKKVVFAPSQALDYELELAAVIGKPHAPNTPLHAKDADAHIFGLILLNDWSARDIQGFEMAPLGPINGKNFATSVSPWIVSLDALKQFEVSAPKRVYGEVAPYLHEEEGGSVNYDIRIKGSVGRGNTKTTTCEGSAGGLYWTFRHLLAQHVVGGCGLRTGDLVASGTVSGEGEGERGCLLESTRNGQVAVELSGGGELRYLEDGDEVVYEAVLGDGSAGIGFGACVGVVRRAREM